MQRKHLPCGVQPRYCVSFPEAVQNCSGSAAMLKHILCARFRRPDSNKLRIRCRMFFDHGVVALFLLGIARRITTSVEEIIEDGWKLKLLGGFWR